MTNKIKYFIYKFRSFVVFVLFFFLMHALESTLHHLPTELYRINKDILFNEVDLTDIYYSIYDSNKLKNKDILLVNIGGIELESLRKETIKIIDSLMQYQPKKIGIDLRFVGKREPVFEGDKKIDYDSALIATIKAYKDTIVLAKYFQDQSIFDSISDMNVGDVKLPVNDGRTVRTYYNYEQSSNSDTLISFANVLLDRKKEEDFNGKDKFFLRYSTSEFGYYHVFTAKPDNIDSFDFPAIEASDLYLNQPQDSLISKAQYGKASKRDTIDRLVRDHIVIIGYLGKNSIKKDLNDITDKFKVPTNDNLMFREKTMPGMVVHANAAQMILDLSKNKSSFSDIDGIKFDIIIFFVLAFFYYMLKWIKKIKYIVLEFVADVTFLIVMTLVFIGISIWLMKFDIHLRLDCLLFYLLILIECKHFLESLEKYIEKKLKP